MLIALKADMRAYVGLFFLSTVASASVGVRPASRFPVTCPCGKSAEQVTICIEDPDVDNFCSPWASCKRCRDGLAGCLECPEGFEGPSCTNASGRKINSRPKRRTAAPRPRGKADEDTNSDEIVFCDYPGTIENGKGSHVPGTLDKNDAAEYFSGARFQYSCNAGYSLVGDASLTCDDGGFWSSEVPLCRKVNASPCDDPGFVSNSHRRLVSDYSRSNVPRVFQNGESVFYSCKSGDYLLKGSPVRTCRNGKWSKSKPSCTGINVPEKETKFCRNPGPILDGTVSVILPDFSVGSTEEDTLEYPEGTRLLYYCGEYHALIGFSVLTCQTTGSWSSDPPMCSSDCGRILDESKDSMKVNIDGSSLSEEWPWTVAVAVADRNYSGIDCAGALLDGQTVITVAHCVQQANSFVLYFGKRYWNNKKDDSEVMVRRSTHLISHRDFNITTMDFDVALIKFAPKIEFTNRIQPICLPSRESTARNIMTGRSGFATGWGKTEHQIEAEELQMAQFTVLTNNACMESMKLKGYNWMMTQNQFCAGRKSGLALCDGYSGAPLVFYNYNADRYILEGLTSVAVLGQCGLTDVQTMFTRVLQFIPWILENM